MTPHEKSIEARKERSASTNALLGKGLKTATALGTAGASVGIASRLMPLLNEYVPIETAIKGIGMVSPKLGNFLQRGMEQGLDVKEGLQYIKDKVSPKAPDQRNIIQQYSPELFEFLQKHIQQGRAPLEAGALAETSGKFKRAIRKMVEDHKAPFSSILEAAFGSAQQPQQQQPQGEMQGKQQLFDYDRSQQPANADQALMAALDKILKM